jgi:phosphoribosylformylglycinamidine cyclo-ligase
MTEGMTYAKTGVDYKTLDPFKVMAQEAALRTSRFLREGSSVVEESRGESVFLIERPDCYLAHVVEGLGTKNLVADAVYTMRGITNYDRIAQDTVAMIVNDMITLGAMPLSIAMHLAVGDPDWLLDERRGRELCAGWANACEESRAVWGPGETPMLKDIVIPGTVVLSGSAQGIIEKKERRIRPEKISHGDAIVFLESSGIHANGLTLARKIAAKLPQGYTTIMDNGRPYGQALLDPTLIYVGVVDDCLNAGIDIHYAVNVTGHGWRKFMRAKQPFTYMIDTMPALPPIFDFLRTHGPIEEKEAYGTLNMGVGFALYVPEKDVDTVVGLANANFLTAFRAGHIERGDKKVVIAPKDIIFEADSLELR